jgi:hypothetical protein
MSGKQNTLRYIMDTALPEVQMQPYSNTRCRYQPDILHRLLYIFNFMYNIQYNGEYSNVKTQHQHFIVYAVDG